MGIFLFNIHLCDTVASEVEMPEVQDRILILSPKDDLETIKVLSSEVG